MGELEALGAKVAAATVDDLEHAKVVADEVGFPVGYGVGRDIAAKLGSWWEDKRDFIQPSEFIVGADGKVMASSYSAGPLGRFDATDVVRWLKRQESLRASS